MALHLKVKISGADKIEKKLKTMEKKVAKKVVRDSVKKAQKIELSEAKQKALSLVGGEMGKQISDSLKIQAPKQKKGSYALNVQIDKNKAEQFIDKSKAGKENFIPAAIEYGHISRDGSFVKAIPFMRTSADETKQKRIDTFESEIKKGINNA